MIGKRFFKYRPITSDLQFNFVLDVLVYHKIYWSSIFHFSDPFEKVKDDTINHKIISFSTNSDDIRLWSYYASWHQGIMIEFEFDISQPPFNDLTKISYTNDFDLLLQKINNSNYYMALLNVLWNEV